METYIMIPRYMCICTDTDLISQVCQEICDKRKKLLQERKQDQKNTSRKTMYTCMLCAHVHVHIHCTFRYMCDYIRYVHAFNVQENVEHMMAIIMYHEVHSHSIHTCTCTYMNWMIALQTSWQLAVTTGRQYQLPQSTNVSATHQLFQHGKSTSRREWKGLKKMQVPYLLLLLHLRTNVFQCFHTLQFSFHHCNYTMLYHYYTRRYRFNDIKVCSS